MRDRSVFSTHIKGPCRTHVFIVSGGYRARVMKEYVEFETRLERCIAGNRFEIECHRV